jgi:hypothetical protein
VSVDLISVVMWMLANDAQGRDIESLDKAPEARGKTNTFTAGRRRFTRSS